MMQNKVNGRTHAFRHPAFWGRRIIVTASGEFIEAHSGKALGRVAKVPLSKEQPDVLVWRWQRAAGHKSSGSNPEKFLHSDWLPLMRGLKAELKVKAKAA